jgi:tetratricopeptide (TPR) repeat protein
MGLFDFLKGRKVKDPDELRAVLIDAAPDPPAFESLCTRHEAMLVEHAPGWSKVPESMRADPEAMNGYAQMLIMLAQDLAERGHPQLLETITGGGRKNPITEANSRLAEARERMAAMQFEEALESLGQVHGLLEGFQGPGRDQFIPFLEGFSAECLFQLGRADDAIAPMERARALCIEEGDAAGTMTYTRNLLELHRYRGDAPQAADAAERLADLFDPIDATEAERLRARAARIREGEPPCRVVAMFDGEELELDDLPPTFDGGAKLVFVRDRVSLARSTQEFERGRQLGSAGELAEAADAFRRAAELDGKSPGPCYELGFTLALMGRFEGAVEAYDRTEALAPGWFHCREGRYIAQLFAEGSLPTELFGVLVELQDGASEPADKLAMADAALGDHPDLSLLHLHRGIALSQLERSKEAADAFRRGLEATRRNAAIETRLFSRLAAVCDDATERNHALDAAIERDGDRVSAAMARLMRRARAH